MDEIKRMPINDFRNEGYLHEVNRLVLHPLGLALEVNLAEDGTETLGGVWDCREDPEGVEYGDDLLSAEKAEHIAQLMFERRKARAEALKYVIQPVGSEQPVLTTTYVDPAERSTGRP